MNAGTHLGEAQSRLLQVEAYSLIQQSETEDLNPLRYSRDLLQFEYRKNLFLPPGCVVWRAEWKIDQQDPTQVKTLIDDTLARRKTTQPIDYPSCGSVFKNPKASGLSAWQVIDQLGLRGHRIGAAQFSEKHSNFIINLGGATASDVKSLIELAQSRAEKELGIQLEEEVIYLS
jgi:UDP-N-acetylmuramate dehydrogenase